jgi:lactosylceramide 4-alpha-galactosyltransferase
LIQKYKLNQAKDEFNFIFFNIGISSLVPGTDNLCPTKSDSASRHSRVRKTHKVQNIFFLETSGFSCLTARQACSVESAARSNPYAIISVHMENSGSQKQKEMKDELAGQRRSCAITNRLFKEWNNVKLIREDLLQHLRNTTLWRLYEKSLLSQSIHPLTHRSDAVRVAMLWKFGGIYLDLDCLVFRPLYCLQNTVGLVDFLPNCNITLNDLNDNVFN